MLSANIVGDWALQHCPSGAQYPGGLRRPEKISLPCWALKNCRSAIAKPCVEPGAWSAFLTQPFFSTEQFTGKAGKRVDLEAALEGCDRILNDEFARFPEQALYMIGTVDEAKGDAADQQG